MLEPSVEMTRPAAVAARREVLCPIVPESACNRYTPSVPSKTSLAMWSTGLFGRTFLGRRFNMSESIDVPRFHGHPVRDPNGNEVGTITDVVYEQGSLRPRWGVVSPGKLKAPHYVPLMPPSYLSENGAVIVPYDKRLIMQAPKARGQHVLTPNLEHELELHYSVAH